ncbi:hypothetical protein GGP41_005278 [Bipolaris sorokiniana]|uniref:Uncharacterized protein n=1 Tax=Cochliobolus sativus TaxID=45130 RepID=A0A8H6DX59_COCSA|nr:hypothetical protein GGP41_005278 [Bipolaris sorokiniana]
MSRQSNIGNHRKNLPLLDSLEKIWPRGTTGAKMLPSMATPRERGTTSRRRRSAVSAEVAFPERIPAWTAAP